jgi:hypothetical protein
MSCRRSSISGRSSGARASIFPATSPVVGYPQTAAVLKESGLSAVRQRRALRGIADELEVYEIP